jgi:hypothetical protein
MRNAWNVAQTLANILLGRTAERHVHPSVTPVGGQRRPGVTGQYEIDQGDLAVAPI